MKSGNGVVPAVQSPLVSLLPASVGDADVPVDSTRLVVQFPGPVQANPTTTDESIYAVPVQSALSK